MPATDDMAALKNLVAGFSAMVQRHDQRMAALDFMVSVCVDALPAKTKFELRTDLKSGKYDKLPDDVRDRCLEFLAPRPLS